MMHEKNMRLFCHGILHRAVMYKSMSSNLELHIVLDRKKNNVRGNGNPTQLWTNFAETQNNVVNDQSEYGSGDVMRC